MQVENRPPGTGFKTIGAGDRLRINNRHAEMIVRDFSHGTGMVYGAIHVKGSVERNYAGVPASNLRWPWPEETPLLED